MRPGSSASAASSGGSVPLALALALAGASPTVLRAQALPTEQAAHSAIILTPVGALPEVVRAVYGADTASRVELTVRYGRYRFPQELSPLFHNYGLSARAAVGRRLRVGATAGYRSWEGGDGVVMGSVDVEGLLWQRTPAGGDATELGVRLAAGRGRADETDLTATTFSIRTPLAVTLPQGDAGTVTIFIAPAVAYGTLDDPRGQVLGYSGSDGAARMIFGAGVGYIFPFRLGAHLSIHRVLVEDSGTQLGFAGSWRLGG